MSISPERYCLGGLMKDIDKDSIPEEIDSKTETVFQTSVEQNLSSNDSPVISTSSPYIISPNIEISPFPSNKINEDILSKFSKKNILLTFNNQKSTKQLQKTLANVPKEVIDIIINELSGLFSIIIKNRNGNYFCTDLFKLCTKEHRFKILKELSKTLSTDCTDEYGAHPIQKLIELSSSEEEYKLLLSSFNDFNKILIPSLNKNGSYCIQKIIVQIPETFRMEFNLIFVKLLLILSRDMYGVCTLKKFIGYTKNELIVKQILNALMTNFVNISSNQYGNYLIQYLMEKWWKTEEGFYLKKMIVAKFQILSSNHYSSYICSLFLKLSNNEEKKFIFSTYNKNKNIEKKKNNIAPCPNKSFINNNNSEKE